MAIALCASAWCQAGAILLAVPAAAQQAMTAGVPVEAPDQGLVALFNELFAPNYVNHSAPANQNDRAAREQAIRSYRAAAPDLRVTIDDMIAEGDKVALRWTTHGTERGPVRTPFGIAPPTDRPISIPGVNIFRIANGQIAEEWIVWDTLSWAEQLGFQMRR